MHILVPLDFNKNEIRNALVHVLATDPGSPTEGQVYYNSTSKVLKFYTGSAWRSLGTLDQIAAAADVSAGGFKVTNLGTPTAATDAATKGYVDTAVQGISWKDSVRVGTIAAGTLTTSFAAGQAIDGVTLVLGDRILIKNQTLGQENGIYLVTAGTPTRATDADVASELVQAAVLVEEGTTLADTLWVNSTSPITLGTTPLVWVNIGSGTGYAAGNGLQLVGNVFSVVPKSGGGLTVDGTGVYVTAPLSVPNGGTGAITNTANGVLLGNGASAISAITGTTGQVLRGTAGAPAFGQLDLASAAAVTGTLPVGNGGTGAATLTANGVIYGNGTSPVAATAVGTTGNVLRATGAAPAFGTLDLANANAVGTSILPIGNGGTGAATAAAARTALAVPTRYTANVGDGAAVSYVISHNLNTRDAIVQVFRATTPWDLIVCDVEMTSVNTTTLRFAVAPTSNAYRVVIIG